MAQKTLYMESTEVAAEKTAAEITSLLMKSGARQISMDYGEGGRLTGLRFALLVESLPVTFALPVRVDPVFKIINDRRPTNRCARGNRADSAEKDRAQAERVAWRQLLRWVQAQLAMIETGMVQPQEVFLPYLVHAGSGQTLFEYFQREGMKQLAAPAGG